VNDFEPEDAYDAGDPVDALAANLGRRIALVDGLPEPRGTSVRARLAAIAQRVEVAERRHRRLDERARVRLAMIAVDLDYARGRL
jgi:hypothetical protein